MAVTRMILLRLRSQFQGTQGLDTLKDYTDSAWSEPLSGAGQHLYVYKEPGEQLVAAETGIIRAIVRPSIVNRPCHIPWRVERGLHDYSPARLMILKVPGQVPADESCLLDITPVGRRGLRAAGSCRRGMRQRAGACVPGCDGDANPLDVKRVVGLTGLYKRKPLRRRTPATAPSTDHGRNGARAVIGRALREYLETHGECCCPLRRRFRSRQRLWGRRITEVIYRTKKLSSVCGDHRRGAEGFRDVRPFIAQNSYVFSAANVRRLFSQMRAEDGAGLRWEPETLDWYSYWLNTHVPGLERWVFPTLEEELRERPQRLYTYRDLLELFDTATNFFSTRVAHADRAWRTVERTRMGIGRRWPRAGGSGGSGVRSETALCL